MEILTVKEASKILKVHPATVKRWIANGQIEAFKVGRDWRIDKEAIDSLLDGVR